MQRKLFKKLWILRFQKMLRLEEESIEAYEAVLGESKGRLKDDEEIREHLKTLIQDEKKHARLVRELLKIVKRQAD
jgi:rubrerythrin